MRHILPDLRYALRTLRRQPAFTAAALIGLAFGIGANTILFTIINAIALRPIPVLRGVLIALQFAVCLVLIVGAGLFIRALQRAETLDLGFDPTNVLYLDSDLRLQDYDAARALALRDQVVARGRQLPGVQQVTLANEARS